HHYGDQLKSTELLQLLGANTATKMCGSPASSDLSRFSSYMQCEPQFLLQQQPRKSFAVFVRGLTPSAISLPFPYIDLAREPRMTEAEWRATREANRKLYGIEEPTNFTGASQTQKSGPAAPVPPSRSTTEASGVVPSNQPQTQEGPGLPEPSPRAAGNQTAVGDSSA